MMKTRLSLLLCALLALTACSNDDNDVTQNPEAPTTEAPQTIKFNLTASHPDDDAAAQTRAVKQTWEAGDAIFVFFTGAEAPKHLKMTFDGTSWSSAEYDGTTQTAGALGLKNGDTGTMRAVFLPFGSSATVSASGTSFTFSKTYYAYYLTATLSYTVADNEVSGAFAMTIPDDYVQFYVEDAAATDEGYTLGCDAVIPTGIASITADGTVTETSDKTAADDMPGYSYGGGYLFSGKLTTWSFGSNYYFAKRKASDGTRHDYFVTGKTLASHSAVKLPAASNVYALQYGSPNKGKWVPVGSGITVKIGSIVGSGNSEAFSDFGTWQTCNYGSTRPEDVGTRTDYNTAKANTLPTKTQCETIINHCSWTTVAIHGQIGKVVHPNSGFLFLPMWSAASKYIGQYWSSTEVEDDTTKAWYLDFYDDDTKCMSFAAKTAWCAVRAIVN